MKNRINLAVLISGRGSNLKSIIDHIKSGYLDKTELKVVIANKEAPGLKYANEFGIHTYVVPRKMNNNKIPRDVHDEKVMEILGKYDIDLICLAGYLQILGPKFVNKYKWCIMNIHPAILPAFTNTIHAQKDAVEYGVKISGCTVHFVDDGVDTGPIIIQAAVPVKEDDSGESLAKRILEFEHIIYPKAIKMFTEGRLKVDDRRVIVKQELHIEKLASNSLDVTKIEENLRKIGVSTDAIHGLLEKTETIVLTVKDITPREAIIIKQEMLALGGDCAVPKECVLNSLTPVSAIIIGNKKQLKKLTNNLSAQAFKLPRIAEKINKSL